MINFTIQFNWGTLHYFTQNNAGILDLIYNNRLPFSNTEVEFEMHSGNPFIQSCLGSKCKLRLFNLVIVSSHIA